MRFFTFLFILLFINIYCEVPNSFKTNDNSCDSFTNIFSEKAEKKYINKKLLEITTELQNLNADIGYITAKIQSLSFICIAIILVLLVLSIVKIIFIFIAKLFRKCKEKDVDERIVKLEQRLDSDEMFLIKSDFDERIEKLEQKLDYDERIMKLEQRLDFDEKLERKLEKLGLLKGNKSENLKEIEISEIFKKFKIIPNPIIKTTKFFMKGYDNPIELETGKGNTVVQVKKQICSELQNCGQYAYKIMKLSLSGQPLDDNKYFSSFNLSEEDQIVCEFDKNADPNNIVVIQLKGNVKLPKLIQIEKYRKISYLRNIINRIEDINENCKIFCWDKINKNQLKEMNNSTTIEECQLEDEDVMQIILGKEENLEITSIFNDELSIRIEYTNVDLVCDLRVSIAEKLQLCQNEFFLLLNDRILSNDKFAFEYFTEKYPEVKYCKFMNLNDIDFEEKVLVKGTFGELYKANIKKNDKEILIKKYNIMVVAELDDNSHIIRELKKFQITKSHPRFIQVLDLYKDNENVFVAMENMPNGTLSLYLKTKLPIPEHLIVMWSKQILEGLKFLNRNEIMHRDLNPKSIFLDKSLHIKLSNFNLAKYFDFHNQPSVHNKFMLKTRIPLRYVAPETITNEVCNARTDVWSFGAIFLRISTNKKPYTTIQKRRIINHIFENGFIDFKCPYDVPYDKKEIVEMCMRGNSNDRPTIEDLLNMPFFQQA